MSNTPSTKNVWLGWLFVAFSCFCLAGVFFLQHWLHNTEEFKASHEIKSQAREESRASRRETLEDEDQQVAETLQIPSIPQDTPALKKSFYKRLLPAIIRQNAKISKQRQQLQDIAERQTNGKSLSLRQQATLETWALRYRAPEELSDKELVQDLMTRIDVVPPSMALAQAAMESAWGRSRFAKEANNYFGQWCFTAGCGVVPSRRIPGATHEVASFDSLDAAVAAYMLNINSHPAYEKVREIRADFRQEKQSLDSLALAEGLEKYSEKGEVYIHDLQGMIRFNKLKQFDPKRSASTSAES
ncbi:glucosaminidase domain-containing protein [Pseudomaricurvus sp.]|uniref:glucosaminidase domain-containing protein n=1 Tax=Pseudomaricurvus sp. TaxID=2004510 RepID=UPI003F6A766D